MLATEEYIESLSVPVSACLAPWQENPYRLVSLWDMYQFYAHGLLTLFDMLRDSEVELSTLRVHAHSPEEEAEISKRCTHAIAGVNLICERLHLSSAQKQVKHIIETAVDKSVDSAEVRLLMVELRRRIREDLEDHVYFCIPEGAAARFFKRSDKGHWLLRVPSELMDSQIVARFPAASDDIEAACRCFMFDCFPASMFHLMRVVEIAVLKLAKLTNLNDPKPSWGSILKHVEKLVLRTRYEDLDPSIKPHRKLLEDLLPQMQAIQRAWRNKISHVEDKIVPIEATITESIAREIMTAVEAFMRQLASDLPAGV